jgi:hypothetical protein
MPQVDGRIRFVGKVHGVRNYIIEWADDPEGWEFKQFVSQEQLEAFATENNLIILENTDDNTRN